MTTLLGYDGAGVESNALNADYVLLGKFTASSTGTLSQIKVKLGESGYCKVAIYSDNSGTPGTRLAKQDTGQAVAADAYTTINLESSCEITSGTSYWVAVAVPTEQRYYCESTGGDFHYGAITYSIFTFPSSGSSYNHLENYKLCFAGLGTCLITLAPTAIASAEAFGSPKFTLNIAPSSIASLEAFGSPTIQHVVLTIAPAGIPTVAAFGVPTIKYPQVITPGGIPSAEAFGTPGLYQGIIRPSGIASAEAFGVPVITRYGVHVILEAEYFEESPEVNRAFVAGADLAGGLVSGSDLTSSEASLVGERLEVEHNTAVTSATVAASVAAAVLDRARLDGSKAKIVISPHCGVELWDVISIVDDLCDQSADYRVMGYTFEYDSKLAIYCHYLRLSSV